MAVKVQSSSFGTPSTSSRLESYVHRNPPLRIHATVGSNFKTNKTI